jgi:hypothetical protein
MRVPGAKHVVHEPQLTKPPHPFECEPQRKSSQVSGVHPQTFGVPPPPQVWLMGQEPPQEMFVPQPFGTEPQLSPAGQFLTVGVHPQTFAVPPPPHVFEPLHAPQLSVPPQPLGIEPQSLPCFAHVVGVHPQTFAVPAPPHV